MASCLGENTETCDQVPRGHRDDSALFGHQQQDFRVVCNILVNMKMGYVMDLNRRLPHDRHTEK